LDIITQAIAYYHNNSHQLIINIAESLNGNGNMGQDMGDEEMAPLNLEDLQGDANNDNGLNNIPQNQNNIHNMDLNETGNTSFADESFGADDSFGGKRSTKRKKLKSRKNKKSRKGRKSIKSMYKIKGGTTVYGNGYGSNCNDPNYNIYNTNLLKLFPYNAK